jgi:hypothetical protein
MVFRVQWLTSLGPILWDFGRRSMSFIWAGRTVKWSASAPPNPIGPSVALATVDVLEELSHHFAPLFAKPTGLPPQRRRSHQICLLSGTSPIVVCPYQYAHHQKQELEHQCSTMLH